MYLKELYNFCGQDTFREKIREQRYYALKELRKRRFNPKRRYANRKAKLVGYTIFDGAIWITPYGSITCSRQDMTKCELIRKLRAA